MRLTVGRGRGEMLLQDSKLDLQDSRAWRHNYPMWGIVCSLLHIMTS